MASCLEGADNILAPSFFTFQKCLSKFLISVYRKVKTHTKQTPPEECFIITKIVFQ